MWLSPARVPDHCSLRLRRPRKPGLSGHLPFYPVPAPGMGAQKALSGPAGAGLAGQVTCPVGPSDVQQSTGSPGPETAGQQEPEHQPLRRGVAPSPGRQPGAVPPPSENQQVEPGCVWGVWGSQNHQGPVSPQSQQSPPPCPIPRGPSWGPCSILGPNFPQLTLPRPPQAAPRCPSSSGSPWATWATRCRAEVSEPQGSYENKQPGWGLPPSPPPASPLLPESARPPPPPQPWSSWPLGAWRNPGLGALP